MVIQLLGVAIDVKNEVIETLNKIFGKVVFFLFPQNNGDRDMYY